jgi:transposase
MASVGGRDIHRRQITYDWIDIESGHARHGRIQPATRVELRAWLARLAGQQADFALKARPAGGSSSRSWSVPGFRAHLAEPADTRALRGPRSQLKMLGPVRADVSVRCERRPTGAVIEWPCRTARL